MGGERLDLVLRPRQLVQHHSRGSEQALARRRHPEAPADALEERRAEAPLRFADAVGEGRLRQPEPGRGADHGALLVHGVEHGEVANVESWMHL